MFLLLFSSGSSYCILYILYIYYLQRRDQFKIISFSLTDVHKVALTIKILVKLIQSHYNGTVANSLNFSIQSSVVLS